MAVTSEPGGVANPRRYAAFLSYSHARGKALAPALQVGVEQFGRVWYRRRALRVFRDDTGLAATPHLWGSIEEALAESSWFILLASPDSAQSTWVQREVGWWLDHRSADRLILAVADGSVAWHEATDRVDVERTDALPPAFAARDLPEPKWVDLRGVEAPNADDPAFRAAVVDIAATLHSIPKDELVGEEMRQYRRRLRTITGAAVVLALLTVISIVAGSIAVEQRNLAQSQARLA